MGNLVAKKIVKATSVSERWHAIPTRSGHPFVRVGEGLLFTTRSVSEGLLRGNRSQPTTFDMNAKNTRRSSSPTRRNGCTRRFGRESPSLTHRVERENPSLTHRVERENPSLTLRVVRESPSLTLRVGMMESVIGGSAHGWDKRDMTSYCLLGSPKMRRAFSLVELMVSITIIVLLASVVLFGMTGVQQTAKEQRTRSLIANLNEMIVSVWESMEDFQTLGATPALRLKELNTLTRMELPDRGTDVIPKTWKANSQNAPEQWFFGRDTTLTGLSPGAQYYRDFVFRNQKPGYDWMARFASSECLYMILSRVEVGGATGLEQISRRDIADTDGDGLPEIIDAWGTPIRFIRWPAGFQRLQPFDSSKAYPNTSLIQDGQGNYPFDHFNVNVDITNSPPQYGFFIFPLIHSCGPDLEADLAVDTVGATFSYSKPDTGNNNYPFTPLSAGTSRPQFLMGRPDGDGDGVDKWSDNIHNHALAVGDR
jgi:prepilin-type N-terminal cleavage/methylation domain-containing protein